MSLDHRVVLAGRDDERLVELALAQRRMIGTSLIASGRVPTTTSIARFGWSLSSPKAR